MEITKEQRESIKKVMRDQHRMYTDDKKIGHHAGVCDTLNALGHRNLFIELKQEIMDDIKEEEKRDNLKEITRRFLIMEQDWKLHFYKDVHYDHNVDYFRNTFKLTEDEEPQVYEMKVDYAAGEFNVCTLLSVNYVNYVIQCASLSNMKEELKEKGLIPV